MNVFRVVCCNLLDILYVNSDLLVFSAKFCNRLVKKMSLNDLRMQTYTYLFQLYLWQGI